MAVKERVGEEMVDIMNHIKSKDHNHQEAVQNIMSRLNHFETESCNQPLIVMIALLVLILYI
jgi:hypothetical protein